MMGKNYYERQRVKFHSTFKNILYKQTWTSAFYMLLLRHQNEVEEFLRKKFQTFGKCGSSWG